MPEAFESLSSANTRLVPVIYLDIFYHSCRNNFLLLRQRYTMCSTFINILYTIIFLKRKEEELADSVTAPTLEAVQYNTRTFEEAAFWHDSPFKGASPSVDKSWDNITKSEASLLLFYLAHITD